MTFTERQRAAWSSPPVDDVGYLPASDLLAMGDGELRALMARMRVTRNQGWRNAGGLWRSLMDGPPGRDVLDFGCGTGIEALEQALAGNRVSVADLPQANVALAERVLALHGFQAAGCYLAADAPPYLDPDPGPGSFDVFTANGVLHHIPWATGIMAMAHRILRPGGEARLIVYSDVGWANAGSDPVRYFDAVGEYADWYDRERLETRFGRWFTVERCEYLSSRRQFLGAVLRRRERDEGRVDRAGQAGLADGPGM